MPALPWVGRSAKHAEMVSYPPWYFSLHLQRVKSQYFDDPLERQNCPAPSNPTLNAFAQISSKPKKPAHYGAGFQ